MGSRACSVAVIAVLAWIGWFAAPARGAGTADVAALQVALRSAGVYGGAIDGVRGPGTVAAVAAVQRRAGLPGDGVAGPATRRALGRAGRPGLGSRVVGPGVVGWDVAALQFKLAAHGFPSGPVDGALGPRSDSALQRFQHWAALPADGVAGPGTLIALGAPPARSPVKLLRPVQAALGDRYGPRGLGFHAGVDFPAPTGTPVTAAGFGTVTFVGSDPVGWGNFIVVRHRFGLTTLYAHLSEIDVRSGGFVAAGARIGRVGMTGHATGPHLHFEVLLRGANVDPVSAL